MSGMIKFFSSGLTEMLFPREGGDKISGYSPFATSSCVEAWERDRVNMARDVNNAIAKVQHVFTKKTE